MESLASNFKQLTSDERQPGLEPPKVIASVAASRSPHIPTPPAPEEDIPQPGGQLANPTSPSLETLPIETQIEILAGVTSLESLRTLVHTSPTLHQTYSGYRLPTLKAVLENTLDGVFVDAHATYQPEELGGLFPLDEYKNTLFTASTEPILEVLSLAEATEIASFHLSIVEPLTD